MCEGLTPEAMEGLDVSSSGVMRLLTPCMLSCSSFRISLVATPGMKLGAFGLFANTLYESNVRSLLITLRAQLSNFCW